MKPIDLIAICGGRWKVVADPLAGDDEWSPVVVCENGLLYPAGVDLIGAVTTRAGEIVDRLRELAGVTLVSEDELGRLRYFPRIGSTPSRVCSGRSLLARDGSPVGPA